ncbi:MSCRAMM family protein [Bryocella elongata]|uniref:MSCRAMM family protein n=1 Tax=Bryocella elongata TaxID=863522 RepID=UPI001359E2AF|nr:carboxypeptidase-like regulatory domain-containing protein [Bryocella elongata]
MTGHVTAGDTQLPARFAHVTLFGIPAKVTAYKAPDPNASEDAQIKAVTSAFASLGKMNLINTQTDTDGNYAATDVPPGDYYVFATATGYVAPLSQVQAAIDAGADLSKPLPGIQTLHVTSDHSFTADATMTRGGAISGTVLWDDGSPVSGAIITVQPKAGKAHPPAEFNLLGIANVLGSLSIADDLGHYRVAGLIPGDYVVLATIQSNGQTGFGASANLKKLASVSPLLVYAPEAVHRADAKAISVTQGDDHRDVTITLRLGGLHTITGRVASLEDHHGINSATVRLTDEKDPEFARSAAVDAMGNYKLNFVPPGTYTLNVGDAEDTEPGKPTAKPNIFGPPEKTLRSYVDAKRQIIVTDTNVTGQDFEMAIDTNPSRGDDALKKAMESLGADTPK